MTSATSRAPAVLTERRDSVLLITLNRPESRNAIDDALATALIGAAHAFAEGRPPRWVGR